MRTNIQLPSFHGFYESMWSALRDDALEWEIEGRGITMADDWGCKFSEFEDAVAQEYTEMYLDIVNSELGFSVKQKAPAVVDSPRYYNYRTDRIYVDVEFSGIAKLRLKMKAHETELRKIIRENHTSRDGFVSFMSNDFDEWISEYLKYDNEDFGLYLSYILYYLVGLEHGWDLDAEFFECINDNVSAEWYPDSEEAKAEYEKVLIVEDYCGYGAYNSDKYGQMSVDELRLKMEQMDFDRKYQLKLNFAY